MAELSAAPVERSAALEADWERLAQSPFSTPAWSAAASTHLAGVGERLYACRRPSGELAAVVALTAESDGQVQLARWVGDRAGDEYGPACTPADRPAVARALLDLLPGLEVDALDARGMPGGEGWAELLGGVVARRDAAPLIDLADQHWEAWLASRSATFRQQVRRRERALRRRHDVRLRLCEDPERLADDMDELIRLHELRWSGRSLSFAGERRAFHHALAARALAEGWLRLWRLDLDGRTVAAWYGFRRAGADWFYQSGRDPAVTGSVGFVLLSHTIRDALDAGMHEYRLLLGGEPYKARFATRDPGLERVIVPVTARGRAWLERVSAARARDAG